MNRIHTTLLCTAILTLGACGKKDAPPPAEMPPAPAPAPTPLTISVVALGKSVGSDGQVATPVTVFGVRDTIYAAVTTMGTGDSANIAAKWSFVKADGSLVPVDQSSHMAAGTPGTTELHISKATAWPKGKYQVEVILNNGIPVVQQFTIE